jgi:hypothetical protein
MNAFKPIYKPRLRSTAVLTAALLALKAAHGEELKEPNQYGSMYQRAHDALNTPDSTQVLGSRVGRQRWVAPPLPGNPSTPPPTDTGWTGPSTDCQTSDCNAGWQPDTIDAPDTPDNADTGAASGDNGDAGSGGGDNG